MARMRLLTTMATVLSVREAWYFAPLRKALTIIGSACLGEAAPKPEACLEREREGKGGGGEGNVGGVKSGDFGSVLSASLRTDSLHEWVWKM